MLLELLLPSLSNKDRKKRERRTERQECRLQSLGDHLGNYFGTECDSGLKSHKKKVAVLITPLIFLLFVFG